MKNEEYVPDKNIRVLADDINQGVRRNQFNCVLAVAIQRINPDAMRVRVNKKVISWSEGDYRISYPTPEAAIKSFIEPLDTGEEVKPGTVRLQGGTARLLRQATPRQLDRWREHSRQIVRGTVQPSFTLTANKADYERFPDGVTEL